MNRKQIVLFSTKEIGVKNCLFESLEPRDWFKSPKLCDFFFSNERYLNKNTKDAILNDVGLGNISEERIKFLEKYDMGIKDPNKKVSIKTKAKKISKEALDEYNKLWETSEASMFIEKLQGQTYKEDCDKNVDGKSYHKRFSLYIFGGIDSCVYAVNSLSQRIDSSKKNEWYNALSCEIFERHHNCEELEIFLVLHDKDVYENKTFHVEMAGEEWPKEEWPVDDETGTTKITKITRSVIVFQHQIGEDPIATILHTPSQSPKEVIQKIEALAKLGHLEEMSKECSSVSPNVENFNKRKEKFPSLKNCEVDALDTINMINQEMKSLLNLSENEQ